MDPRDQWILNYHRQSLANGWRVNADGSGTTAIIGELDGPDGRIYMVPYYDNETGRTLTREEAKKKWWPHIMAGAVPVDDTGDQHNARAKRLHDILEQDKSHARPKWDQLSGVPYPYNGLLAQYLNEPPRNAMRGLLAK